MTEILLLGTFHYAEEPPDIFSPTVQDELDSLVFRLAGFGPDAIAVEGAISSPFDTSMNASRSLSVWESSWGMKEYTPLMTTHIST